LLKFPSINTSYPATGGGHTTKSGGKHPTHVTGTAGATGAGIAGTGTHGPAPGAGTGLRRLTVARIVEFTNTKLVETDNATNRFLLIKNLFSLKLCWSSSDLERFGRSMSFIDDESRSKSSSFKFESTVGIILYI
jgi:hypothetical protein